MKTFRSLLLSLSLLAALSTSALAAEVTVDGTPVPDVQAVTMLPLRAVGEALGFTVVWDGSLPGARVDNGQAHMDLTLGLDQYQLSSTTAVGLSAPFSLGAAPAMLEAGVLYVPAGVFRVLLGNRENAVLVRDGGAVSLSGEEGAAVQLPNPLHSHDTPEALKAAVGFDFELPAAPAGFEAAGYRDVAGTLAEVYWTDGVQDLTYRVSKGSGDNSGDYTVYPESGMLTVNGTTLQWRGGDGDMRVAVWTLDGLSYSLRATDGLTETQVRHMAAAALQHRI